METHVLLKVTGSLLCSVLIQLAQMLPQSQDNTKYILIWGNPNRYPSRKMGKGSSAFVNNECEYTNCFVTSNRRLKNLTDFDAIVFNGGELKMQPPRQRSTKQKYVYANMESSHNEPVCDNRYNDFFNWTWTYKIDSDAWWGYVRVYDLNGTVVGPRIDMHWSDLGAVDNETKMLLRSKSIAAAWFVSNCHAKSGRSKFVNATAKELAKYGHSVHIYGRCGDLKCPHSEAEKCNKMIRKDYFFYLAFENSFAEDYVTEKVLTGLENYAVPVVFGYANYSRFLPPGSYLDARELGRKGLARRMASIISSYKSGQPEVYHDFFRWRSRYVIHRTPTKEVVCKICSDLNNPELMSKQTVYQNFTNWWNSKYSKYKIAEAIENGSYSTISTSLYGAVMIVISIAFIFSFHIIIVQK